ncbi:hypothetical protein M0802_009311 [Mischocyttarus mexicanus]|nr:hypothetical protein M0802_009311 [Mischocyttarus mexicanus]
MNSLLGAHTTLAAVAAASASAFAVLPVLVMVIVVVLVVVVVVVVVLEIVERVKGLFEHGFENYLNESINEILSTRTLLLLLILILLHLTANTNTNANTTAAGVAVAPAEEFVYFLRAEKDSDRVWWGFIGFGGGCKGSVGGFWGKNKEDAGRMAYREGPSCVLGAMYQPLLPWTA